MDKLLDHIEKPRTLKISSAVKRAMLLHSTKIPGCPRSDEGSMNHFARAAILDKLKDFGCDFRKTHPQYYK